MTDRELLEQLVQQVAHLQASIDRLAPRRRLNRADHRLAADLLPALAAAFGVGSVFCTAECLERLSVRAIIGTRSACCLGKFLARLADAGEAVDGHLLSRGKPIDNAATWNVITFGTSGRLRDFTAA